MKLIYPCTLKTFHPKKELKMMDLRFLKLIFKKCSAKYWDFFHTLVTDEKTRMSKIIR